MFAAAEVGREGGLSGRRKGKREMGKEGLEAGQADDQEKEEGEKEMFSYRHIQRGIDINN